MATLPATPTFTTSKATVGNVLVETVVRRLVHGERSTLGGGEHFTLGGGGGSRRAGPTGTTTLEVEWKRFSFCGAGPLAGEGRGSTLAGGSLALVSFWQERREGEGERGGRRRYREACMRKVSGCEQACKRDREREREREREGGGGGEGRVMRINE